MPKGGARPGAGRPRGSKSVLPNRVAPLIRALGPPLPPNATDEQKAVAHEAEQALLDVMRHDWKVKGSQQKLAAANDALDRTIGPVVRSVAVAHSGSVVVIDPYAKKPSDV